MIKIGLAALKSVHLFRENGMVICVKKYQTFFCLYWEGVGNFGLFMFQHIK